MSLLVTIFVLVFLTELISWLWKSVLLEIVRQHFGDAFLRSPADGHPLPVLFAVSENLSSVTSGSAAPARDQYPQHESRALED